MNAKKTSARMATNPLDKLGADPFEALEQQAEQLRKERTRADGDAPSPAPTVTPAAMPEAPPAPLPTVVSEAPQRPAAVLAVVPEAPPAPEPVAAPMEPAAPSVPGAAAAPTPSPVASKPRRQRGAGAAPADATTDAEADGSKVQVSFRIPPALAEELRDAVLHFAGPPEYLGSPSVLAERALGELLDRLKRKHLAGQPIPKAPVQPWQRRGLRR